MKESVLISVEGRGTHVRPEGSGDYQPAVYNLVQAVMRTADLLDEGKDPHLRIVVDLGLSPEEYSPTGKYIADRSRRVRRNSNEEMVPDSQRILTDFRAGHGIAYDVVAGLNPEKANSAAYRTVGEIRSGLDLSLAEEAIARSLRGRPYAELERALLDELLLSQDFLVQLLGQERSQEVRSRICYCIHPVGSAGPVEQDYRAALERYLRRDDQPIRQLLRAFGMRGRHAKDDSADLYLKVPIDGHLTSYIEVKKMDGEVKIQDRDKIGNKGQSHTVSCEKYLEMLNGPTVLSYPVLMAEQLVNTGLVEYIPAAAGGPRFVTAIDRIEVMAERADPDRPEMDQMHAQVFSLLGKMAGVPIEVLGYPTDRLINPDREGRCRDLREVGLEIAARLQSFGYFGVPVPLIGGNGE